MKESKRQLQVGEMIRRHFGSVLYQEGSYIYGNALVTVTTVRMSSDLGIAKIYLSIYNTDHKQEVLLMMNENIVRLRQELASRIKRQVRRIPRIAFYIDDTVDEMYRIDALLENVKSKDKAVHEEE